VVLNDIHIDIMDYIAPATCADVQFRSMWAEFEWENKARARPNPSSREPAELPRLVGGAAPLSLAASKQGSAATGSRGSASGSEGACPSASVAGTAVILNAWRL